MKTELIERIALDGCTLVISRHSITLQASGGAEQTADMAVYGAYQPIQKLMQLMPYNICVSDELTEETHSILQQAFLGEHPLLSDILYCFAEDADRNREILIATNPKTESDYVCTLSLINGRFISDANEAVCPFSCREELMDYLCGYVDERMAYELSEAVRKGLFFSGAEENWNKWETYKDKLSLVPNNLLELFTKIVYLPSRAITEYIVHYAILASNSLITKPTELPLNNCINT